MNRNRERFSMPIPTARTLADEVLRVLSDGAEHDLGVLKRHLVETFRITRDEEEERLPSGRESVLSNRIRNATFMLRRDQLAAFPNVGNTVRITEKGKRYIEGQPSTVNYTTTFNAMRKQ